MKVKIYQKTVKFIKLKKSFPFKNSKIKIKTKA
jgi:hypothetical protein